MNAKQSIGAAAAVAALLAVGLLAGAASAGAPDRASGRVYANGELWATFGTADFKSAPAQSVDKIYAFPGTDLVPVGEASPGDSDYNGGHWEVHMVTFADGVTPMQFTSDEDVLAAAEAGDLSIGGVAKYFQCPLFAL
jgi:hypothetical protein